MVRSFAIYGYLLVLLPVGWPKKSLYSTIFNCLLSWHKRKPKECHKINSDRYTWLWISHDDEPVSHLIPKESCLELSSRNSYFTRRSIFVVYICELGALKIHRVKTQEPRSQSAGCSTANGQVNHHPVGLLNLNLTHRGSLIITI